MARKRTTSFVEGVIDIAANLPWPVGVALAVIVYLAFGIVADMEISASAARGELGSQAGRQFAKTFAGVLQWVVPGLLLFGSAISAVTRYRRKALYDKVAAENSTAALGRMAWHDFERLVAEYFHRRGFKIAETGGGGPDGGMDLLARSGGDEYVVQCKQWKAQRVGVVPVRELYGVVAARHAAGGFLVTSGSFTEEAVQFASGTSVELVDGSTLASAIASGGDRLSTVVSTVVRRDSAAKAAPECPKCQSPMVIRTARSGPQVGSQFWGCSQFPACRGTRPTT